MFHPCGGGLGEFWGDHMVFRGKRGGHQSLLTGRDFKKLTAN